MSPDVENNVFAGALGLWVGYLLATTGQHAPTLFFYIYLVHVFLVVFLVTALLRISFTFRERHDRRMRGYVIISITICLLGGFLIAVRDQEPNIVVPEWQVWLIGGIILAWIAAAEVGRLVEQTARRNGWR